MAGDVKLYYEIILFIVSVVVSVCLQYSLSVCNRSVWPGMWSFTMRLLSMRYWEWLSVTCWRDVKLYNEIMGHETLRVAVCDMLEGCEALQWDFSAWDTESGWLWYAGAWLVRYQKGFYLELLFVTYTNTSNFDLFLLHIACIKLKLSTIS